MIEISKEQLEKIIELSGNEFDDNNFSAENVSKALIEIERKLNFFNTTEDKKIESELNVLIVDDLELSVYQLNQLLKKMGICPSVARSKDEALAEIKKKNFDYLIVDLFLPNLEDGLNLLKEVISQRDSNTQNFKIILISSTDDKGLIKKCFDMGINEFIPKGAKWHENILKYINKTVQVQTHSDFSKYTINDNICSYIVNKLGKKCIIDALLRDINASILTGQPNIILNLEKIRLFDKDFVNIFADIYRSCTNNNGKLVLLNPSDEIMSALEFAFLDSILPIANSIEHALVLLD